MGVCNCSMFCCTLLYVHSSIAIILMGKRELIALLNLSSWCLVMVERLFLTVPRGCLQFVIVVFPDHTHLLFLVYYILFHLPQYPQTGWCWSLVSHMCSSTNSYMSALKAHTTLLAYLSNLCETSFHSWNMQPNEEFLTKYMLSRKFHMDILLSWDQGLGDNPRHWVTSKRTCTTGAKHIFFRGFWQLEMMDVLETTVE